MDDDDQVEQAQVDAHIRANAAHQALIELMPPVDRVVTSGPALDMEVLITALKEWQDAEAERIRLDRFYFWPRT